MTGKRTTMAKKLPPAAGQVAFKAPKATTPVGKLHGKLMDLQRLHSAANPEVMSYGPVNVKAPKDVEKAAQVIAAHVDSVMAQAKKSLSGTTKGSKSGK